MNNAEIISCVNRALLHDEDAIERLYQDTYPNASALARHLCSNPNDVDDILQKNRILR